jgi:hypothetical protein
MADRLVEALAAMVRGVHERRQRMEKGPGEGQVNPTAAPPKGVATVAVRRSPERNDGAA